MSRMCLAVIGVGHLGKEHARILAGLPEVNLVAVADTNREQAEAVAQRCGTRAVTDYRELAGQVDAAVIVVPTAYHHAVAGTFLAQGTPVLVEKPLAPTLEQAADLEAQAVRRGTLLQVGHIERFNPAFEELQRRPLRPKFIRCERQGPFTGRSTDIGVVLDLMIHDLDLLPALIGAPVRSVEAIGVSLVGGHEDVTQARLVFANGCVADLTASRISPTPSRCMQLWGAEGYAALDFGRRQLRLVQPSAAFRHARMEGKRMDPAALKAELFQLHLESVELDCNQGDQLTRELQEFVHCVRSGAKPRAGAREGREAVALATRVLNSLRSHAWEGDAVGPVGPLQVPAPQGELFPAHAGRAAA